MRLSQTSQDLIAALEARLATTAEVWRGRSGAYVSVASSRGVTGAGDSVADAIADLLRKLGLEP